MRSPYQAPSPDFATLPIEANPRTGLRLSVSARPPAVEHSVEVNAVHAWLKSIGIGPREQALKTRLRQLIDGK